MLSCPRFQVEQKAVNISDFILYGFFLNVFKHFYSLRYKIITRLFDLNNNEMCCFSSIQIKFNLQWKTGETN